MQNSGQTTAEKTNIVDGGFRKVVDARPEAPSQTTYLEDLAPSVDELSPLAKLNANIHQLEDLCGRLKYMMAEINHVVKR